MSNYPLTIMGSHVGVEDMVGCQRMLMCVELNNEKVRHQESSYSTLGPESPKSLPWHYKFSRAHASTRFQAPKELELR
jgi:hypothetical protein